MAVARFEPVERDYIHRGPQPPMLALDEAGRGPLAGPVSIGVVSFHAAFHSQPVPSIFSHLNDSKLLKEPVRERLYEAIRTYAAFARVVHINNRLIDRMGINPAIEFGMIRAIRAATQAGFPPGRVLVDGNYKLNDLRKRFPDITVECFVKGDSRVFSIAAASVLAKVARDRRMQRYAHIYPHYELERHKGYGTRRHRELIAQNGPCRLHRRSYKW
ncbi:MAG: ribonuclease HII [Leptospiraceae bacterium]|nr:ribonuclease HII [Leptospiraceae bacterium]